MKKYIAIPEEEESEMLALLRQLKTTVARLQADVEQVKQTVGTKEFYNLTEAAKVLGCGKVKIKQMCEQGTLPFTKTSENGDYRIPVTAIRSLAKENLPNNLKRVV